MDHLERSWTNIVPNFATKNTKQVVHLPEIILTIKNNTQQTTCN